MGNDVSFSGIQFDLSHPCKYHLSALITWQRLLDMHLLCWEPTSPYSVNTDKTQVVMACTQTQHSRLSTPSKSWLYAIGYLLLSFGYAQADFELTMRKLTGGSDGNPGTTTEARTIMELGSPNSSYSFTDYTESPDPETINVGGGGSYGSTALLPNNSQRDDRYILKATANVIIPAGTWTIAFGSDDGGYIKIPGVNFTNPLNNNWGSQPVVADTIWYDRGRGHAWTGGRFTLSTPLETTIEALMWESGGGDSWEIALFKGETGNFNKDSWSLLQNGLHDWVIQTAPLLDLTQPSVQEFNPTEDGTGVYRDTDLVVTFDEDIVLTPQALAGNLDVTITDLTAGTDNYTIALNDPSVTVNGNVLTIGSPATLAIENEYSVAIDANAIQDLSVDNMGGPNILDTPVTWSFTTVALDPTPPILIATSPFDGAEFVLMNEVLEATFDDNIVASNGNIYIYDIDRDEVIQTIPVTDTQQVNINGNVMTITPSEAYPPLTELAIRWDDGIVLNYTDVPNLSETGNNWSFTTTSATLANDVTIFNWNFEDGPALSEDDYGGEIDPGYPSDSGGWDTYAYTPSSWRIHKDTGDLQFSGTWNPAYPPGSAESPRGFDSGYDDQDQRGNVAYLTPLNQYDQIGFKQVMGNVRDSEFPNTPYEEGFDFIDGVDYQLKVRIGESSDFEASGYRLQLLAGGVLLAEDINTVQTVAGQFIEATLDYTYDPANAYLDGRRMEIRLLTTGYAAGTGEGVDFDDVRLTYGYNSPKADAGGPYVVTPTYDLFLDGSNSNPRDLATVESYEWDLNNDGIFGDVANVAQPESGGLSNVDLISTYGMKLGENTIALRITDSSGQTSTDTTTVNIEYSSVVPGADFVLIADQDDDGDARWEDLVDGNPSGLELLLDDQPYSTVTRVGVTSAKQITHAYDFPADEFGMPAGATLVATNQSDPKSFQNAAGDWTDDALTLEIWFKPGNLTPFAPDGQVLFEDGGSAGLGLYISNNQLICSQNGGDSTISKDISVYDDFIQAVVTREANGTTRLYVNGWLVGGPSPGGGADWSDGNAAAFGSYAGFASGGVLNDEFFGPEVEAFVGQIAIVRAYTGQVLTDTQVLDNFNAVNATDNIPPFVQTLSPPDDSTDILITSNFEVTFDSDVTLTGAGMVTLKNLSGGPDMIIPMNDASQVQLNGRVLTITPSGNLEYGTDYAVRIPDTAVQDTAGTPNHFAGTDNDTSWNISTVTQDLTAPLLVGMSPADNAFDVSPVGNILQAYFDDDILLGSGDIEIWELDAETMVALSLHSAIDVTDSQQISISGNVLSISPDAVFKEATPYAVHMDSGVVTNTTYIGFAGFSDDATWNFSTSSPLFFDGFETPDVTALQSDPLLTSQLVDEYEAGVHDDGKWVRSAEGFGATHCGIVDEESGQVSDPTGRQAFAFRRGNTGLTTAKDSIGNLIPGITYRVSFDVVQDGQTNGRAYEMALVTFDDSGSNADRTDATSMGQGVSPQVDGILHTVSGNAPDGGAYQRVSFDYVAPTGHPAAYQDMALRFRGSSISASIDNVSVELASFVDVSAPSLISIVDNVPSDSIIDGNTVIYTVSFDEDIQSASINAADFSNTGSADITIDSVVETADNSGIFRVTLTTGSIGTLILQINSGAVILDMGGNALDTSSALVDDTEIIVNYSGPNEFPYFVGDPFDAANATEETAYSSSILSSVIDPDVGDTLTFAKIDGPDWLSVAADGGLSGTPSNDDVGINVFTVSVTDGKSVYPIEGTMRITVINTNDAPVFTSSPLNGRAATEGVAYNESLLEFATDDDADANLTFVKISGPSWLNVASDGSLTGTPDAQDVGINVFTITMTDGIISTPLESNLSIEVFFVNDTPIVDAGNDDYVNMTVSGTTGWSWSPWNNDADSGISSQHTYTVAHSFGSRHNGSVTINDVTFTENFDSSGDGWEIGGTITNWGGDDDAAITGESEKLAESFVYNGNPRTVTLTGLTPGRAYEVNFYSVAWENGTNSRVQTFTANGTPLPPTTIAQSQYGNNQGIRITCVYEAAAATQQFTIQPVGGSFHLYGFSNHETGLASGTIALDGSATDEEGDSMLYTWEDTRTGTANGSASFSNPNVLNPDVTFSSTGTYVLRLNAFDGNSTGEDLVTITAVIDNDDPTLASTSIVDDQGGAAVVEGDTVTYTVVFSEGMDADSFDATDFSNAGTALYLVRDITQVAPTAFSIQIMPISTGSLRLQVPIGATLTDNVGNPLDTSSAILDDTSITVNQGPPNQNPVFVANPLSTSDATEDALYSDSIAGGATDADTDPVDTLTYAKVAGPDWLSIAPDGSISGTPTNDHVGLNTFTISVDDGRVFVPVEGTLSIMVLNTNDAPRFNANPVVLTDANEDFAYNAGLAPFVTEEDASDTLAFAKVSGPDWLNVASDGSLSGIPTNLDIGLNVVTVSVTDGIIASPITTTLNITVLNTNDAPVVHAGGELGVGAMSNSGVWTPTDISMVAWYDAKDTDTITKSSSNKVSRWDDKSGNANHATQAQGAQQPTYQAIDSIVGGQPSIGSTSRTGKIGLVTPSMGARNAYVVTYYKDGNDSTFDDYATLFSGPDFFGQYRVMGYSGQGSFLSNFNTGTYKNGSSISNLNGVLSMPPTLFTFKSSAVRTQAYALGFNQSYDARGWDGAYCEWIFTDGTEDAATQAKIEGYLAHKWGLEDNLAAGHPYESSAPTGLAYTVNLAGEAIDEDGDFMTYAWSKFSGPGDVTFGDAEALNTSASFTQTGTYVLHLVASDGTSTGEDYVTVNVAADSSVPTLAPVDIVDDQGGASVDAGATVTYTFNFSEDMNASTISAEDFSNAGSANITVGAIIETLPGVFTVEVTPSTGGSLRIQVSSGALLTDNHGNALDTTSAIADDSTLTVSAADPFDHWASAYPGLSSPNPALDFDSGGLPTSLEWVLGGDPTDGSDDRSILPNIDGSDADHMTYTFRRLIAARDDANTTIEVRYSDDMSFDKEAVHNADGVAFVVTGNPVPGVVEEVTVTIPKSLEPGGKMFVRLQVSVGSP